MTYPDQRSVAKRLNAETRAHMRRVENAGQNALKASWDETRHRMRNVISSEIVRDFGGARWNAGQARRRGTFLRIDRGLRTHLDFFVAKVQKHIVPYLREARFTQMSRTVYMMTQLVPPTVKIKVPIRYGHTARVLREAAGDVPPPSYTERLNAWLQAYRDSLTHNLNLGAIHEGTLEDALAEVDATKVGSPAFNMWDAIDRLFAGEFARETYGPDGGYRDAMDANADAPFDEVWVALGYPHGKTGGVACDECIAYDGMTRDEVQAQNVEPVEAGDVHPWCYCRYELQPKDWADLAGTGQVAGVPPTVMSLRGEDGKPVGMGVISYTDWLGPNLAVLTQARRAAGLQ